MTEYVVQGDFTMIVDAAHPDAAYEFVSDFLARDVVGVVDSPRLEGWCVVEVGADDE